MVPLTPPATTGTFPFVPGEYRLRHVHESWEHLACLGLRRAVFCEEQGLFDGDDRDDVDGHCITIAAIACVASIPERVVGTVRIHEAAPGCWQGSRLAVLPEFRSCAWIGTELIRHAVCTAHARGARMFIAHVQLQNLKLFRSLHWTSTEMLSLRGRPHVSMKADLGCYPPRIASEVAFFTHLRRVA